jgi:hypothetical protein
MYSASVSHHRQDGVHQPPIAFHSQGVDFAIAMSDNPRIKVTVHSQDVTLFDMNAGRFACEQAFAEASESRVAFTLQHCNQATNHSMNVVGLGFDGKLEFRECALTSGALVAAFGEVTKDRDGRLQLYPWRPPPQWHSRHANSKGEERDPLAGRVMASDDPALQL